MLERYMRDGCTHSLAGDWRFDPSGDIIRITYDEKRGVFEGRVIRPVKWGYDPGHLLFIVNFPHNSLEKLTQEAWEESLGTTYGSRIAAHVAVLRAKKNCRNWWFEGIEHSFDQTTKNKTNMKLKLTLQNDRLYYTVGGRTANFTRPR